VGGDDHPDEQVAELGAGPDVRGEVPRVDVCDRGDECRAEHRQRRLPPALGEDPLDRAQADRVDGGGGFERGSHASSETRIARARVAPSTCTSPPERAESGPSNGWRSTTARRAPGAIPRSARERSLSGSAAETRTEDTRPPRSR